MDSKFATTMKATIQLNRLPEVLSMLGLSEATSLPPSKMYLGVLLQEISKSASSDVTDCTFALDIPTIMGEGRKFFYVLLRSLSPTGMNGRELLTLRTCIAPANLSRIIDWREDDPKPHFDFFAPFKKTPSTTFERVQKHSWVWIRNFKNVDSGKIEITFELNVRPLGDWFGPMSELLDFLGWKEGKN